VTAARAGPWARGELSSGERLDRLLLRCVDAGLVAVIFVVPLIFGGRVPLGQLALVALTLWVAVCWCLRQSLAVQAPWVRSPAELLLWGALALAGLQLVPLPPRLLGPVSPHLYEILPLWAPQGDSAAALGVWATVSLTPAATRNTLVLLLAFALLFLMTVQRVRAVEDAERIIRWIAVSTVVMAVFALIQYLTSNGQFFWFYEHPSTDTSQGIKGSFTNRNHFANFIALGVGPLIWWVWDARRHGRGAGSARGRRYRHGWDRRDAVAGLRIVALALSIFVGLMSLSRGGAVAMFVAAATGMLILYRGSLVGRKALLVLAGIALLVAVCLQIHGRESVTARIDDFGSIEQLDTRQSRRMLWQADAACVADYPLTGTGLGSHAEVCPMYLPNSRTSQRIEYTHAENGYLQVAQEAGVPGLLLALIAVGLCGSWCLRSLRRGVPTRVLLCLAAIAASLAASFVHSMVDFVWYVPGCMVAVVMLAACAGRLGPWAEREPGRPVSRLKIPRYGWLAAAAFLVLIGYFMVQNLFRAVQAERFWHRYRLQCKALPEDGKVIPRHTLDAMAEQLSGVVAWQPDHARARAQLAAVCVKLFDYSEDAEVTPLNVRQVREAALDSDFQSSEQLHDWLRRAFGPRCRYLDEALQHARRAVTLCPLQGEGYLYLADLSFLEGPDSPGKAAYVRQALRVRPFDGAVLFSAGQEAVLAGDLEEALGHWRASFHAGPLHQQQLLQLLAPQFPVASLLKTFQPDLAALRRMRVHYGTLERPDALAEVLAHYAKACETESHHSQGSPAANRWLEAAKAHQEMGNVPEQLRCLRSAVGRDTFHYGARFALARCLYRMGEFAEAERHLTWCLQRKPQDENLRALLETAVDRRLRVSSRPIR
jgi:O-antigen ligase/tetratricopeptide (TPR) repeat protein